MKSVVRSALILVILLVPSFTSAQNYDYTQTIPGWSSQSTQFFSGGVSVIPGGMFGIGGGGFGIASVVITVINIINLVLVPLLFAISFIVFLYGVAKAYIFSSGDEAEVKKGHQILLWGLIGFAVMVSVWGLVNVVVASFNLTGFAPRPPVSQFMMLPPPPPI